MLASTASGISSEHDGENGRAEQVRLVLDARPAARAAPGRPRRASSPSAAPWRAEDEPSGTSASAAATPPMPQSTKTGQHASGPWRRSSSQPKTPTPDDDANCAQPFAFRNAAVTKRHGSPSSAVERRRPSRRRTPARCTRRRSSATSTIVAHGRASGRARRGCRGSRRPQPAQTRRRGARPPSRLPSRARGVRGGLGTPAVALDLRRPLAQPRAAVRALGDVGADLRPAALADDEEVGAGTFDVRS